MLALKSSRYPAIPRTVARGCRSRSIVQIYDCRTAPASTGVRRSFVDANGVRFHVTEAGPVDGRPVLALHGWPQHHWEWRDLLADPPPGLRIIAPDLPGYGWSGPPPHRWAKEDIATDVLALLDAMGLDRVLLVGPRLGRARRAPDGPAGARTLRRLSRDEHGAPVADTGRCCRICGGSDYQLPLAAFGVSAATAHQIRARR